MNGKSPVSVLGREGLSLSNGRAALKLSMKYQTRKYNAFFSIGHLRFHAQASVAISSTGPPPEQCAYFRNEPRRTSGISLVGPSELGMHHLLSAPRKPYIHIGKYGNHQDGEQCRPLQ